MESTPNQAADADRRVGERRQDERRKGERRDGYTAGSSRGSSAAAFLNAGLILALQFVLIVIFCS